MKTTLLLILIFVTSCIPVPYGETMLPREERIAITIIVWIVVFILLIIKYINENK